MRSLLRRWRALPASVRTGLLVALAVAAIWVLLVLRRPEPAAGAAVLAYLAGRARRTADAASKAAEASEAAAGDLRSRVRQREERHRHQDEVDAGALDRAEAEATQAAADRFRADMAADRKDTEG